MLPELDREYTLFEIAIITSAGPARRLGLTQKGHLGVGADADVAIYNEKHGRRRCMFALSALRIKGGEVVVEEGEIREVRRRARSSSSSPTYDPAIEDFIRPLFQQYYTMSFDNYPVELERIEHPERSEPCRPKPQRHDHAYAQRAARRSRWKRRCSRPDVIGGPVDTTTIRALPVFHGKRQCRWTTSSTSKATRSDELEIRGDAAQGQVDRPRHDARAHHASPATPACTSART